MICIQIFTSMYKQLKVELFPSRKYICYMYGKYVIFYGVYVIKETENEWYEYE